VDVEDALVLPVLTGLSALAAFLLSAFFGEAHAKIADAQTLFTALAGSVLTRPAPVSASR
jgi:hypothetical protein